MDKVRFGRALGYGARHATRTVIAAMDAATSPNPRSPDPSANDRHATGPGEVRSEEAHTPLFISRGGGGEVDSLRSATGRAATMAAQTGSATRHAVSAFTAPVRRVSSVIFLQVMGSFFALLAFLFGSGAWRAAGGWHSGFHPPHGRGDGLRLGMMLAMTALFAYFSVANFVRASRRDRQGRRPAL